jgi:ankyrin repeat protein
MAGDLENVKLLLAHGADPDDALASAVTFGYPEIVKALIAAGASAKGTESSGINLLHWAVITNHPEVIPALVKAGVPVNATDNFGYTPLMYAATIDFGNAGSVAALLKAGADLTIRNDKGRTPVEQARYYHHAVLEKSLH